ncbi:MAG: hypothetical protein DRP22_00530 [Verrucomicrobia bacterium]|nr:MAG: hypothetical protein DRP22_00530 [Verrucomicrobiota bacterium]
MTNSCRSPSPVVFYISGHGLGHASRSCEIVRAFICSYPEIPVRLVSAAPDWFVRERLGDVAACLEQRALDVGLVQVDPIRVDRQLSAARVAELLQRWDALTDGEAAYLKETSAGAVVCDVPAVPVDAAHRLGIPAIVSGNFTWDWIYQAYDDGSGVWKRAVARFQKAYACADLLLKMPFSPSMDIFDRQIEIPLVAAPGRNRRSRLEAILGVPRERLLVLLAFSSLPLGPQAMDGLARDTGVRFLVIEPAEVRHRGFQAVSRRAMPFGDLIASVDVVVSKAGFGIVSDCIANRKPLVLVERPDFPESELLVREAPEYIPCRTVSAEEFYQGNFLEAVYAVAMDRTPKRPAVMGGATLAAEWVRKMWYPAGKSSSDGLSSGRRCRE